MLRRAAGLQGGGPAPCHRVLPRLLAACRDGLAGHSRGGRPGALHCIALPEEQDGSCSMPLPGSAQAWSGQVLENAVGAAVGRGSAAVASVSMEPPASVGGRYPPVGSKRSRGSAYCAEIAAPFAHGRLGSGMQQLAELLSDASGASLFFLAVELEPCVLSGNGADLATLRRRLRHGRWLGEPGQSGSACPAAASQAHRSQATGSQAGGIPMASLRSMCLPRLVLPVLGTPCGWGEACNDVMRLRFWRGSRVLLV